jgi:photosystem II stability/assembly factor-like uncharacterized protein
MIRYLTVFSLCFISVAFGQTVKVLTSGTLTSIRGLSVVNEKVVWASGSSGTVGRSIDGGTTWQWMKVKGFDSTQFRDIEAFDANTAVIMGIGSPAFILRTINAGETWTTVYRNNDKGMFLDALEFWNEQSGIVIGDPIDNKIFIARTFDGGKTWREIPAQYRPIADSGEACFASSGTNIRQLTKAEAVFVTGGLKSRVYIRDKKLEMPIMQGKETTGANSIAVKDKKTFIVVGGDYTKENQTVNNCVITTNAGASWIQPQQAPGGYRSCVEYLWKKTWITCGTNGVDISTDEGRNWTSISKEGFHVVRKAKSGKSVFLAGGNGKIRKLVLN